MTTGLYGWPRVGQNQSPPSFPLSHFFFAASLMKPTYSPASFFRISVSCGQGFFPTRSKTSF